MRPFAFFRAWSRASDCRSADSRYPERSEDRRDYPRDLEGFAVMTGVKDTELYYERYGQGPPLVFSHGWLDDCSVWHPQARALADDHTVVLYDLRGHGRSGKPEGEYSVQTLADDLGSLIRTLELEKVVLVGFSLGGMLSLLFALRNPAEVSGLVLVGTAAKMTARAHALGALMRFLEYPFLLRRVLARFRFHKPSRERVDRFVSTALQVPREIASASFAEFTKRYDIRKRISAIKAPTLIVAGEEDLGIPIKCSRYLHREIEGSQLSIVPGCGHELMVEKPEEFNRLVKDFLGGTV